MKEENSDFIVTSNDSDFPDLSLDSFKYTIGKCIYTSETGFAKIFMARKSGRLFILKALREEYRNDPVALAALKKEFEICFSLDLAGAVSVYDLICHEEIGSCIVMKYYQGSNLRDLIDSGFCFDIEQIEDIFKSLVKTLKELHQAGIAHRDIKPSNIIFNPETKNATILDFGCADAFDQIHFKANSGTPFYKPANPESAISADWYALSITMEELASEVRDRRFRKNMLNACREMKKGLPPEKPLSTRTRLNKGAFAMVVVIILLSAISILYFILSVEKKPIQAASSPIANVNPTEEIKEIPAAGNQQPVGTTTIISSGFSSETPRQHEKIEPEKKSSENLGSGRNSKEAEEKTNKELEALVKDATETIWWEARKEVNKLWHNRSLSPNEKDSIKKIIIEEEQTCRAIKDTMKQELKKITPAPDPAEIDRLVHQRYRVMFKFFDDKGIYGKEKKS